MTDIAVALDFPGLEHALELVDRLETSAPSGAAPLVYKVGLELFTREGPAVVDALLERGARVFLDLKLHDIPNTVAGAARAAGEGGVEFLTVHATGGDAMVRAAVEAVGSRTTVLAVTVLTSLSDRALGRIWKREGGISVREEVARLASDAVGAGAGGVVASAREAHFLRSRLPDRTVLVTPGIRLRGDAADDQERISSPGDAVRAGADLLVIGRSITRAEDPVEALRRIREEARAAGRSGARHAVDALGVER